MRAYSSNSQQNNEQIQSNVNQIQSQRYDQNEKSYNYFQKSINNVTKENSYIPNQVNSKTSQVFDIQKNISTYNKRGSYQYPLNKISNFTNGYTTTDIPQFNKSFSTLILDSNIMKIQQQQKIQQEIIQNNNNLQMNKEKFQNKKLMHAATFYNSQQNLLLPKFSQRKLNQQEDNQQQNDVNKKVSVEKINNQNQINSEINPQMNMIDKNYKSLKQLTQFENQEKKNQPEVDNTSVQKRQSLRSQNNKYQNTENIKQMNINQNHNFFNSQQESMSSYKQNTAQENNKLFFPANRRRSSDNSQDKNTLEEFNQNTNQKQIESTKHKQIEKLYLRQIEINQQMQAQDENIQSRQIENISFKSNKNNNSIQPENIKQKQIEQNLQKIPEQSQQLEKLQQKQTEISIKQDNLNFENNYEKQTIQLEKISEDRAQKNKRLFTQQNFLKDNKSTHNEVQSKYNYQISQMNATLRNTQEQFKQLNSSVNQNSALNSQRQIEKKGSATNIQLTSGNRNEDIRHSFSASNEQKVNKKDDNQVKYKKGMNELIIMKIKEQCINKKYNDPIALKKSKSKIKIPDDIKLLKKMNSTTTGSYYQAIKEEGYMKSSKERLTPLSCLKNESDPKIEKDDENDEDSIALSNNASLDLDDDEDDKAKQSSPQPTNCLVSTQNSTNNVFQQRVQLLKSVYQGRPSTIFFPYNKQCQQPIPRDSSRAVAISEFETKKFNLKYQIKGDPYKCVMKAFEEAGYEQTEGNDWNALWSLPKKDRVRGMNQFQKYNHFPGCWNLGRKDFMWRCLYKLKRRYPKEMDFIPNTYLLCNSLDWDRFLSKREEASKNTLWILKPADQACGRGVRVINKKTKIKRKENYIICDYIANPHLINGLKYDLRLYVVVTSYDPLRIYLYEEGLTRFATEKYTTNTKDVSKRYVHLTNYSVNKHAAQFVKNKDQEKDGEGSKQSLTSLKLKYKEMGINVEELFEKIKDVIIKTCISAEPTMLDIQCKSQEHRTNCYELYGFDVLIDSNLKPWIIEVNVCPSLASSSPLDRKIKHSLLADVLNLAGLTPYDKKQYSEDKKNNHFSRSSSLLPLTQQESEADRVKMNFSKNINDISDLNANNCFDKLSPENWEVLFETDEEYYRKGHFERIYPVPQKEKLDYYSQLFECQRFNNIMVQKWITSNENYLEKILKKKYHNFV